MSLFLNKQENNFCYPWLLNSRQTANLISLIPLKTNFGHFWRCSNVTTNEYNHLADPIMRELLLTNNGQPDLLLKTSGHVHVLPRGSTA